MKANKTVSIDWDKPIKTLLIENGFTVRRVKHVGRNAMQILKDGEPVDGRPFHHVDYAIELLESLEQSNERG